MDAIGFHPGVSLGRWTIPAGRTTSVATASVPRATVSVGTVASLRPV